MRFWLPTADVDSHAAFRALFTLPQQATLELQSAAASDYEIFIDDKYITSGPARFTPGHPEFLSAQIDLPAGDHIVSIHATHTGVDTRLEPALPPFIDLRLLTTDAEIPLKWKGLALPGYRRQTRRINPQLGWIEWSDTRPIPPDWKWLRFNDTAWPDVTLQSAPPPAPAKIASLRRIEHALTPIASGPLAELFGYEQDDIPARFMLRDLECKTLPSQGAWRRYDLQRVRLGKLSVTLDLPAGAVVEIAYAEALRNSRVTPYITLSAGPSCNLDHFIARGGQQTFEPLQPRGGRFIELHILLPPFSGSPQGRLSPADQIKFLAETYHERTYHPSPLGSFTCPDPQLTRIWTLGLDTYRACSEDAIIDNPTRERGQWTGDAYIGMETASVAFDDLRLAPRALVHAAENARPDGLVSGLTPGNSALSSYAAQWVTACVRYHQLSGDRALLEDLFDAAVHNLHAFEPFLKPEGLIDGLGWAFIDWGYHRAPGPIDLALNLHYLRALRAMQNWCAIHGWKDDAKPYADKEHLIAQVLSDRLKKETFEAIGYNASALMLRANLVPEDRIADCIKFIKHHWLTTFPCDPSAPRLSDPSVDESRIVTPYFAHYAFPALIDHNETDFVLDMYKKCWGWMLSTGATTCLEVFDTRWSHCHQWAACPTWQLSRYVLGLHPRHDLGVNHFDLNLKPGSLESASGLLPIQAGSVQINWSRTANEASINLTPTKPITVHHGGDITEITAPQTLKIAI